MINRRTFTNDRRERCDKYLVLNFIQSWTEIWLWYISFLLKGERGAYPISVERNVEVGKMSSQESAELPTVSSRCGEAIDIFLREEKHQGYLRETSGWYYGEVQRLQAGVSIEFRFKLVNV